MVEQHLSELWKLILGPSNTRLEAWQAGGGSVIGTFCHYIPSEVILAAGAVPIRLRGAGCDDSSEGDAFMSARVCTYVRHVMSLVLEGHYDFLDGAVSSNTCDHVRRAADLFNKKTNLPFKGFVSVPRSPREDLYQYYLEEIRNLFSSLSEHLGVQPGNDALRCAISLMNDVRRRLIEVNELRVLDRPKLTGAESLAVHIAAQVIPPTDFIEIADELVAALREREGLRSERGRLLLVGAELDEPAYVSAIESQGALVVADRLCFGARSVLDPIDSSSDDPLDAIGRAYFFRPSCARMIGDFPARWGAIKSLAAKAKADGIVFTRLLFCDPWGADQHNILHRVREGDDSLPLLTLDREYGIVPTGQLKTRVQAFVERLEIARAQRMAAERGGAR